MKIFISNLIFAAVFATTALAGDAKQGEKLSAQCVACHTTTGNSISDQFPNIAGQVPGYIAAQLAKFKSGERESAIMKPLVANFSAQDMKDLDAYYGTQKAARGAITPDQEQAALAGGKIYRGGYKKYEIPACMGCHGPSGHGIPPKFPRLSGQHAAYIESQLLAFKSATRKDATMNPIAFALSAEQIKQLALYISALY